MNGEEIIRIASHHAHTRKYFGGVYASNLLPLVDLDKPLFFIINTDVIQGSGEHWVMVNSLNGFLEWFDPLGYFPIHYNKNLHNFLTRNGECNFTSNITPIQSPNSTKCGYFCLTMADLRVQGYSLGDAMNFFDGIPLQENDFIVHTYVNSHMRSV